MSDNQLLQSLTSEPSVKQALLASINEKRAGLNAQLAELDAAAAELGSGSAPKGRPRGPRTGPTQRQQILEVLAENKAGLRAREIASMTGIDTKVIQTTISTMRKKHEEVKAGGTAKRDGGEGFVYSITSKGKASLKEAVAKAAAKAAAADSA